MLDHDFHHLLADESSLRALGVAGGSNLSFCSLSDGHGEHSEEISVSGLGLNEGLNGGVPLLNDGAELVSGDVHSVEVSVAVEALDLFDLDLHLSPGLLDISVQISQGYLEHTAFQAVSGDL